MSNFDRRAFIDNLRATKPPYECPYSKCGRIYKSFSGIQAHIMNFEHETENDEIKQSGSLGRVCSDQVASQPNQKIVEYENLTDGKIYKLNMLEPLEINFYNTDSGAKPERSLREIIQNIQLESPSPNSPKMSPVKVLEPNFRILEEFSPTKAPPMPQAYIKYIETPVEDLEEEVEYDMDEEDYVWLSLINDRRQRKDLSRVSEAVLERVMDFFEKNCHFASSNRHNSSDKSPSGVLASHQPQLFDEDAVCCVCLDGECDNANAILFCDMCNLSVHQECYGVPYIPEGQWLCRRCQLSPSQAVSCVLCPNKGGAFKQTSDNRWAHVTCAIWVPEVQFANTVFLEPIEGFERIPPARWKLVCYVCKQKRNAGACIQCHKPSCYTAFHVTCAQSAGLFMKIEPVKDVSPGGTQYGVRKTAYCDAHEPANDETENGTPKLSPDDVKARNERREEAKIRIRKARRLLNQRRNSSPSVSIPVVSKPKLKEIASELKFVGKMEFLDRLLFYWTLKRQSRFGVPLLRRLQVCQQRRLLPSPDKEAGDKGDLASQVKYWKQVRRDLEKTRLLIELLRKREQRKRDVVVASLNVTDSCLKPLRQCLTSVVGKLLERDEMLVFAKPVNDAEVPGYSAFIQHPMDLALMTQKAKRGDYFDLEDVRKDFELMINNCLKFNKKNSFFLKYAQKMRKECSHVWSESQKDFEEACRKVSTIIASLKQEEEESLKANRSAIGLKLTENFQEYIDERAKKREKSKKAASTLMKSRQTAAAASRGRRGGATGVGRGAANVRRFRKPNATVGRPHKQQDIRKFLSAARRKSSNPKIDLAQAKISPVVGIEHEDDGPLALLTNSKTRDRSKSPTRRKSVSPENQSKKSQSVSQTAKIAGTVTFSSSTSLPKKKLTAQSPPRSPCRSPRSKTSPKREKIADSFKTFRYNNVASPGSDLEKSKERKRPLSYFVSNSFRDSTKPSTSRSADPCNDQSDSDREADCAKRIGSNSNPKSDRSIGRDFPAPAMRQLIDIPLEHMDIVWAFTADYPHYFPGVIIDRSSPDYPANIPKLPRDISRKQECSNSSSSTSSKYLVFLFDQKQTWRWLEKRLVEPMFVNNDLDRRKLIAPNKRADEKLLKRAYKAAVSFRCANTGEEPEEFSITDGTISMHDDSDDSSS